MPLDAFISYSHRADLAFAPRLQSALEGLAKPWWRRRAIACFRDETDLGAAASLTDAIRAALDEARYFVFLASPGAAASPWCRREIEHWFRRDAAGGFDPARRFLIALTDGTIAWDEVARAFDAAGTTALPDVLRDIFRDEPLWIDFRPFTRDEDLTIRHPDFARAIARLSAPLRGTTPGDLIGEDVRRHRQARRWASAAAGAIALFAVGAGIGAWRATVEAETAEERRREADAERAEAERQRQAAEKALAEAVEAADVLVVEIAFGLKDFEGVPAERMRAVLEKAEAIYARLDRSGAADTVRHRRAVMQGVFSEAYLRLGDGAKALAAARAMQAAMTELVARDAANPAWLRDFAIAHVRIGDVLAGRGDRPGALAAFRAAAAVLQYLVDLEPENAGWLRDLSLAFERSGDMLLDEGQKTAALAAYRRKHAVAERLAARDRDNPRWQRDLAIGHRKVGIALFHLDEDEAALDSFRAEREIVLALLARAPRNTEWLRDLSINHVYMGLAFRALRAWRSALAEFRAALALAERLAAADPRNVDWREDVAISLDQIGRTLEGTNDLAAALAAYRAALATRDRLLADWPDHARSQRERARLLALIADIEGELGAAGRRP
jgi:tetratricopeptide (TPR) repeat protein